MANEYGTTQRAARNAASEFSRHVAAPGGHKRTTTAVGRIAEYDASGTAVTAAFGVGLAWWGLRSGGLLGTAALLVGGYALARIWPELTGEG